MTAPSPRMHCIPFGTAVLVVGWFRLGCVFDLEFANTTEGALHPVERAGGGILEVTSG